jgi:hypothetical protein
MKQYPPHLSPAGVAPIALLIVTVAMVFLFVLSMTGGDHGGIDPFARPLEAPVGLGL